MPLIDRTEDEPLERVFLGDANNDPMTGVPHNDSALFVRVLRGSGTAWELLTLSAGTAGTWAANTWVELGRGWYQLCLAANAVTAGRTTLIEVTVGALQAQYGQLIARANNPVESAVTSDMLATALKEAFVNSDVFPFFPVQGDLSFIEGDDHTIENARGPLGPIVVTNDDYDLTSEVLRVGFTQRRNNVYQGDKMNATAFAVATANANEYEVWVEITGLTSYKKDIGVYGLDVEVVDEVGVGNVDTITILRTEATLLPSFGDYPPPGYQA